MRNELRDAAIVEVRSRIVEACIQLARLPGGQPLDTLINDTLYHERKRLETDRKSPAFGADSAFWDDVQARLAKAGDTELRAIIQDIVNRFTEEVRGNFTPWVYRAATSALPRALPLLLNAVSPKRLLARGVPSIADTLVIHGKHEQLRRLADRGSIVLAPTHVSNLDSPVVGWALYHMGLPPFTYGAGLNLFTNPIMSFFMRNLGAYRVDRKKTAPLYKDVLKEYATVALEMGQPNLFFPAGTRVRSGQLEQHLKLGLLSAGLRAYVNNLIRKRDRPNVYIVPCTLNYHLVLEAETLIDDHLQREGKSRYIITDDESSRPRKILAFAQNLVNLDSRIAINVGDALDPFGNLVDEDGRSLDDRGRVIDTRRYVVDGSGVPFHLPQRDRVYTREAGDAIARAFKRANMALSTNTVAFALFERLKSRHAHLDLYRLLRVGDEGTGVEIRTLTDDVDRFVRILRARADAGEIALDPETVGAGDASQIVRSALRHFGTYHRSHVLLRRGDRVFTEDMNLLLYYSNRLRGYGFERELAVARQEVA